MSAHERSTVIMSGPCERWTLETRKVGMRGRLVRSVLFRYTVEGDFIVWSPFSGANWTLGEHHGAATKAAIDRLHESCIERAREVVAARK